MPQEKFRSPQGHAVASHETDKLPPPNKDILPIVSRETYERRVSELLAYNNEQVELRRTAEAENRRLVARLESLGYDAK